MFLEDDKKNTNSDIGEELNKDDTVVWEDVLSQDDDEDLVSLRKPNSKSSKLVDLGDDLELVKNDEDVEEIGDEELLKVLNSSSEYSESGIYDLPEDTDEDGIVNIDPDKLEGQFEDDEYIPRKDRNKEEKKVPVILFAILFAVFVVGGVFGIITFTKQQNLNKNDLSMQDFANNPAGDISQEELNRRSNEQAIPVINEDEVSQIKPQEDQIQEEGKKQVVEVKPSGRINPFLPSQKYISKEVPTAALNFDSSKVPRPPEEYGIEDEATTKMLSISVSGIMYDPKKPSAIITYENNDYFVQRGDKLNNYRVVDIARDYVAIALGKNVYKAKVGEAFQKTANFYGSANYIQNKQGRARQYYSVNEQEINIQSK